MNLSLQLILLQRITGVLGLILLTLQIYLGANHKAIKLHKLNGILAYFFVLLHPILYLLNRKIILGRLDFYYVFVDICILCEKNYDYLINFGRISFVLITLAVLAAKLRDFDNWLSTNWRKVHILNYLAFYFVSIHSILIGTDSSSAWFIIVFAICQIVVLCSIIQRLKILNSVSRLTKSKDRSN